MRGLLSSRRTNEVTFSEKNIQRCPLFLPVKHFEQGLETWYPIRDPHLPQAKSESEQEQDGVL